MKIIILILFTICISSLIAKKYVIIGAGPVGLYLSTELLKLADTESIKIIESRNVYKRPQCLRLPFVLAKKFPIEVRIKLWPVETLRETIFKNRASTDHDFADFWPSPNNEHFPRIQVGNFQLTLIDYLTRTFGNKFTIDYHSALSQEVMDLDGVDIIFFTAGGGKFNKEMRKKLSEKEDANAPLKIEKTAFDFIDGPDKQVFDGIYLTFNNVIDNNGVKEMKPENYMRGTPPRPIQRTELSKVGLTYSATNNANGNIQLYTYDVTEGFKNIYRRLNQNIKTSMNWPSSIYYKTGEVVPGPKNPVINPEQQEEIRQFTASLRNHLNPLLERFLITLPDDAHLQWAPRNHYAYEKVSALNNKGKPVVFAGDAMGGTDYKYGLNLGRGLYEADQFTEYLRTSNDIPSAITKYQTYWNDMLKAEFGRPKEDLSSIPNIFYKYVISGRHVNGQELGENDFQVYKDALKKKNQSQKRKLKKKY